MNNLSLLQQAPEKVLVLCPHPDDFDIAGVTLRHFQQNGSEIFIAVAPTSSGILDSFYGQKPTQQEQIETRLEEQRKSIEFFGLDSANVDFFPTDMDLDANGEMAYSEANKALIEKVILRTEPKALFIPHSNDPNPAHNAMYRIVVETIIEHDLKLFIYQQKDPKTQGIKVNAYFPIDEKSASWKRELLKFHQSQDHRNRETRQIGFDDRILDMNEAIAEELELDCQWAEAFEVLHSNTWKYPVEVATEYTEEIFEPFIDLIPQLGPVVAPTKEHVKALIEAENSHLFLMRSAKTQKILATITVGTYMIPTGIKAWIEDVVIDDSCRGKGLGTTLMEAAHGYAEELGFASINLTSTPTRIKS